MRGVPASAATTRFLRATAPLRAPVDRVSGGVGQQFDFAPHEEPGVLRLVDRTLEGQSTPDLEHGAAHRGHAADQLVVRVLAQPEPLARIAQQRAERAAEPEPAHPRKLKHRARPAAFVILGLACRLPGQHLDQAKDRRRRIAPRRFHGQQDAPRLAVAEVRHQRVQAEAELAVGGQRLHNWDELDCGECGEVVGQRRVGPHDVREGLQCGVGAHRVGGGPERGGHRAVRGAQPRKRHGEEGERPPQGWEVAAAKFGQSDAENGRLVRDRDELSPGRLPDGDRVQHLSPANDLRPQRVLTPMTRPVPNGPRR